MKSIKYIVGIALVACLGLSSAQAGSTTVVVASGGMSNLLSGYSGSALLSQAIITSPQYDVGSVRLVDTSTNSTYYTNAAYIGVSSYVTNLITMWTNFFGSTNYSTNITLVDITNTVAAVGVAYNVPFQAISPTNQSANYSGLAIPFNNGIWATNTGRSNVTVTITYTLQ